MNQRRGSAKSITSVNSSDSGNVNDIDNGSLDSSRSRNGSSSSYHRVIPKRPSELQLRRNSSISSESKPFIEKSEEGSAVFPNYEDISSPTSPLKTL